MTTPREQRTLAMAKKWLTEVARRPDLLVLRNRVVTRSYSSRKLAKYIPPRTRLPNSRRWNWNKRDHSTVQEGLLWRKEAGKNPNLLLFRPNRQGSRTRCYK